MHGDSKAPLIIMAWAALTLAWADGAAARMAALPTVGAMTRSAARVFRGHCTRAEVRTLDLGGARIPATLYTFRVREHLKGHGGHTVTFHQVGTPEGGPRDLGRLVGLPAYAPGTEYVLFLLPTSWAGMTSPAGAGDGAYLVTGDRVRAVHSGSARPARRILAEPSRTERGGETMSYRELRDAVLAEANQ